MIEAQENGRSFVPFTELIDLANEKVGGQALYANDDFFAPKENLLKASAPVFIPDKYTEYGKWMDGWESRRKRVTGYDHCIVRLGLPGAIRGVNIDTAFFVGNFPEYASLEGCEAPEGTTVEKLEKASWVTLVPKAKLRGGTQNLFAIADEGRYTHLRLNIFPDGGVARLRVHGEVRPDWKTLLGAKDPIDLAAASNGGTVVTCNDMFFGGKDNLILPGRARTMGDGWETRRRRGPGYDWIVVQLAAAGRVRKIEVDTNHFKGNFPDTCSIEGCVFPERGLLPSDFRDRKDLEWKEILPRTKLQASHQHFFEKELKEASTAFDYIRLNIFPDGGVSRLRVFGEPAK